MDKVFHSHTAQADMQAKQDIYDLILPSGVSRHATLRVEDSAEKTNKVSESRIEHKV